MPTFKRDSVSIYYEEEGSGQPLLIIPGGGLSSTIAGVKRRPDFNPIEELKSDYRCIVADLRNAPAGQSRGPLEIDRPWDAFTDDHLALMDHLQIDRFLTIGFCIGAPLIWNLIKRAPHRVVAAVFANPSGVRIEQPELPYLRGINVWATELLPQRPDISREMIEAYLSNIYPKGGDFVWTVDRAFVRKCETPILILPDDIPEHPYAVALETAMIAPNSQMSMYPWHEPKERVPLAVRHIRTFLRAHRLDDEEGRIL